MKLISIIVPVYKVEKYLRTCINSLLAQTYSNIEIILVDDGSPDSCPQICDEYAALDSRVHIIHKENGGLSDARNAGIMASTGDYIGFVDSDDWVSVDMYEQLMKICENETCDIAICGYSEIHDDKSEDINICFDQEIMDGCAALSFLVKGALFQNYAWNKLYNAKLFKEYGIKYPVGINMEDLGTTYRLFEKASKVGMTETPLYYYRVNRDGSILADLTLDTVYDTFLMHQKRYELAERREDLKDVLMYYVVMSGQRFLTKCVEKHQDKDNRIENIMRFFNNNAADIKANKLLQNGTLLNRYVYSYFQIYKFSPRIAELPIQLYRNAINSRIRPIYTNIHVWFKREVIKEKNYLHIKNMRHVFLLGTPDHNNLGDHAIALAEIKFLKCLFPEHQIVVSSSFSLDKSLIEKYLLPGDIIALTGGGDLGDQYLYIEKSRREIIKTFKNNKIVLFPQTMYFTDTPQGRKELNNSIRVYSSHPDLTLFAREHTSYELMKRSFSSSKVIYCPDIVLSLNMSQPIVERQEGILLCLRSDIESTLSISDKESLRHACIKRSVTVDSTDTAYFRNVSSEDRAEIVNNKICQFKRHRLVITDRLHGVIFSAISGVECIAIGNYNHKVSGICEVLNPLEYIHYVSTIAEACDLISEIGLNDVHFSYSPKMFESCFHQLADSFIEGGMIGGKN